MLRIRFFSLRLFFVVKSYHGSRASWIMDYALYEKAFFNLVPEFERINSGQKRRKSKNVTFLKGVDSLNETLTLFL